MYMYKSTDTNMVEIELFPGYIYCQVQATPIKCKTNERTQSIYNNDTTGAACMVSDSSQQCYW